MYARFFAPAAGVDEDPATGSAAASLVAGLALRSPGQHGTCRLRVSQGVAMGRPSTLHGTAHRENGLLTQVTVGGNAVVVGTGTMDVPADRLLASRKGYLGALVGLGDAASSQNMCSRDGSPWAATHRNSAPGVPILPASTALSSSRKSTSYGAPAEGRTRSFRSKVSMPLREELSGSETDSTVAVHGRPARISLSVSGSMPSVSTSSPTMMPKNPQKNSSIKGTGARLSNGVRRLTGSRQKSA